ncbi:MAG: VanZ family protein [Clostridia bacterium]|nr:VanZ family protein [Clostridia bacterium]
MKKDRKTSFYVMLILFVLYAAALLYLTLLGRSANTGLSITEHFGIRGNLVPLCTVTRQIKALLAHKYSLSIFLINVLGNLAAFAPLALFLPYFFGKCRNFFVFFAVTSAVIISVEALQLIAKVGSFDVDDYILNIAGASLLFLILTPYRRKQKNGYGKCK